MAATRKFELPEELWARILRHRESHFGPTQSKPRAAELKALSLVCQLFGVICQKMLFEEISVEMSIQMDYKNPQPYFGSLPDSDSDTENPNSEHYENLDLDFNSDFGSPSPESELEGTSELGIQPTIEKWKWEEWEKDMHDAIYGERRLTLIGTHDFLRIRPRTVRLQGLNTYHDFPANPFLRPPENQSISRSVFDAFHGLRQTLCGQLPAFANLRRLELSNYPVSNELLKAVDDHSRLTELKFEFCWFPESTSPLTSITSLSFGQIPGSHMRPPVMVFIDGHHPLEDVPDHHVASSFGLISLDHLEHLDVSFGCQRSKAEPIFKQLCGQTSMKGAFRCLRRLSWHFDTTDVPTSLVVQFLEHTPTLRDLAVHGTTPALYRSSELFPPRFLTCLETLVCPLDWAQVLAPGRPVGSLNIWAHCTQDIPKFLASTETELDDLLRPLTMCPSLTTLHFPHYPPVAPTELLVTYLAARFPLVRDLKIAVAGERVAFSNSFVCGLRGGPGMLEINSEEQVVEDGLLESLERDVREDVERILAAGLGCDRKSNLLPIRDRIKVFGGASMRLEATLGEEGTPESPSPRFTADPIPSPSRARKLVPSQESPLAVLSQYFEKSDNQHRLAFDPKPESVVDLLYFLARGWYSLPPSLQVLTIYSCFERPSPGHYSGLWVTPEMDWAQMYAIEGRTRGYTQAVLAELSRVYPKLTEFRYSDVVSNGFGAAYHRAEGHWQPMQRD